MKVLHIHNTICVDESVTRNTATTPKQKQKRTKTLKKMTMFPTQKLIHH